MPLISLSEMEDFDAAILGGRFAVTSHVFRIQPGSSYLVANSDQTFVRINCSDLRKVGSVVHSLGELNSGVETVTTGQRLMSVDCCYWRKGFTSDFRRRRTSSAGFWPH